jgi:hypothetical protein
MMSTLQRLLGALVISLGLSTTASAHTIIFAAGFLPEGGPTATGTGFTTVTFDTDLFTMRIELTFSGTSGNTSASHIHCCTASPGVGNVGVATQLPSFVGFPLGVTGGSYDHTFDMSLASSWNPAFVTANGGLAGAFNALVVGLQNDRGYLNIHTSTFPGGEIRARLAEVPEPASALMIGMGLVLLARQRRARA